MKEVAPFPRVKVFLVALVDVLGILPVWRYLPKYPDERVPSTPEWFFKGTEGVAEEERAAHLQRMEEFTIEVETAWRERFRNIKAWENAMDLYFKLVIAGNIIGFVIGLLALVLLFALSSNS